MPGSTLETPILIVGGGPVGLALASDLGLRGTSCLLIEQGEGLPDHPRATALNSRSMEFMRRCIAEAVHAAARRMTSAHGALLHIVHRLRDRAHRALFPRRPRADQAKSGTPAALQSALSRSHSDQAGEELRPRRARSRCYLNRSAKPATTSSRRSTTGRTIGGFRSPRATWSIAAAAAA
jgi:2-polyprenyl-6-methoxyphenol hydroxylase-like FAD-dependent oxidoreductase